jgi:papain fold toxin 1 (glutamine deamidase) of polymorphic toxin system
VTALPSPIPHPLQHLPFDVPRWVHETLEWVVGADWPAGDEAATWDVADRWYAVAAALAAPHEAAFAAAAQIMTSDGNGGFHDAWQRLAGDPSAPLNSLIEIAHELGGLVEGCGRDLEAAKLEAWIEVGLLLTELLGTMVAATLTLGAAAPAAGGLLTAARLAARLAVRESSERLTDRLAARPAASAVPPGRTASSETTRRLSSPTGAVGSAATRTISASGVLRQSYRTAGVESGAPAGTEAGGVTRRISRSERERIAGTLGPREPRPATHDLVEAPPKAGRAAAAEPGLRTVAIIRPRPSTPAPVEHIGYIADVRRDEHASFLAAVADETRARIRALGRLADQEVLTGSPQRGEELRSRSTGLRATLAAIESGQVRVAAGELDPAVVGETAAGSDPMAADDPGAGGKRPAAGERTAERDPAARSESLGHELDDRSRLTGQAEPAPIDRTRRYDTYGGLRAPLGVHQKALDDAMPANGDGRSARLADPRSGRWFGLANGGGPAGDPTRGLNCLDAVLALFDTYVHGRPRVAAARTFDSYAAGDPDRPIGGEWHGLQRVELATGATFQNLCPFLGGAEPDAAGSAVDAAIQNLANHLHNSGHGAFAFILTDLEGGGCHAWAAANHDGTILFLDPQLGRISEEVPLYRHRGVPSTGNVVSMDALVVDGQARPAPLPYHGPGQWSTASVLVTDAG